MAENQEVGIKVHFNGRHVQPDGLLPVPQVLYAFSPSRVILLEFFLSNNKKKSLRILWYFNTYFSVHLTHFPKHRIFKHQSWHKGKEILSGFVGSSTLGLGALPSAFPVPISASQSYSSTSTTLPRATAAEEVSPPLMASSAAEHRRFSCPLEKRRYSCAPVTAGGTSKWSGKQGQEKKPLFVDGGEDNDN